MKLIFNFTRERFERLSIIFWNIIVAECKNKIGSVTIHIFLIATILLPIVQRLLYQQIKHFQPAPSAAKALRPLPSSLVERKISDK